MDKKKINSLSETAKGLLNLFQKMDWKRYQEFKSKYPNYAKKIKFTYKNKFTQEIEVNKKQYYEWRKILEELVKTK